VKVQAGIRLYRWNQEQFGNEYRDLLGTVEEVDQQFLAVIDEGWEIFSWYVREEE
jgi:hypothetical protein